MAMSIPRVCKPEFVGRRLHGLGRHLGEMSGRVRLAVVEAIRATVADMARDAVDLVLFRRGLNRSMPSRYHERREEFDPWDDDQVDQWSDREYQDDEEPMSVPAYAPAQAPRSGSYGLAVALAAAGWWLRQQGTLLGAFGVAVAVAAAAALTKRLAWDGMPLVEAASDLLSLQRCLSAVAALLTKA
jgi:hypothetical protein